MKDFLQGVCYGSVESYAYIDGSCPVDRISYSLSRVCAVDISDIYVTEGKLRCRGSCFALSYDAYSYC